MGLGFGLERGEVTQDDLVKARQMVPRALEQYVTQLAEKGPCSSNGMPQVSSPCLLSLPPGDGGAAAGNSARAAAVISAAVAQGAGGAGVIVKKQSDGEEESESDVDVN